MVTGVLTSIALLSLGCFQVTPSSYANGAFAGFGLAVGLASVLLEYVKHTRNNLFDPLRCITWKISTVKRSCSYKMRITTQECIGRKNYINHMFLV